METYHCVLNITSKVKKFPKIWAVVYKFNQ